MLSCRRFAQVSPSDEEEDFVAETRSQGQNSRRLEETMEGKRRERKMVSLYEEFDKDDEEEKETEKDNTADDVKPVGEPVKVTDRGTHYEQFDYGGNRYELEDSVMLYPDDNSPEPYIAIIKDITQKQDGSMTILGQWFYRQEEAKKKGGENWDVNDTREVFYSFHRDEVPAESVMHRCVVYFVPAHKQLPKCKDEPCFIVRKVYDAVEKKLWKLTDKDYEVSKQHEIDLFVEKSMSQLGDLPDLETEEDVEKAKRSSPRVNISPVDAREDEDAFPNKCLEKLPEAVQNICFSAGDEANVGSDETHLEHAESGSHENPLKGGGGRKMLSCGRFYQVSSSDNEEDFVAETRSQGQNSRRPEETMDGKRRKRKKVSLYEESYDDDEEEKETERKRKKDDAADDVKPVGEPVQVTDEGTHYGQFEYGGNRYELEDSVLLNPDDNSLEPYIAIIKDITRKEDGSMTILGQWFYRQEEAKKKGGGNWDVNDTREVFYSFHRDEFPAESVMHRCVVYFVPAHKQLPKCKDNKPCFIVRKVYDAVEKKLWKLTDKDYEVSKKHEIDLFVEKSMSQLGDLPDLENEEDVEKTKRSSPRVNIPRVDVKKAEDAFPISSEYHSILDKFYSLTDDSHRNKCLAKLLEAIQNICFNAGDETNVGSDETHLQQAESGSHVNPLKHESFPWPDAAVSPVCALELALNISCAPDYSKYNQRIRTLSFNLKNTALLAKRLLNGELKPEKILNMSPTELKEGLTDEETEKNDPDDGERMQMQMTDVRCSRCSQLKVGLTDIFLAGHGDRYQLECIACGNSWYASRDDVRINQSL